MLYRPFCALENGVHLEISSGDCGAWEAFTTIPAKCWKCKEISADIAYLVSGTGLTIGMSKKETSNIIGYKIKADTTSIKFEEIEKTKDHRINHSQTLRLVFQMNRLVSFSIYENREIHDRLN